MCAGGSLSPSTENNVSQQVLIIDNVHNNNCRYISREELEQAMTEYGMGDEANIKAVLDEVDKDRVSFLPLIFLSKRFCPTLVPTEHI